MTSPAAMTETNPTNPTNPTNSIVSLLMDELRQSLEPKILNALADYNLYKETHEAVMKIPFVKRLLENQCTCDASSQSKCPEPIKLEIIDVEVAPEHGLQNLDSINEYINSAKLDLNGDDDDDDDDDDVDDDDTNHNKEVVESETEAEEAEEEEEAEEAVVKEEEEEEEEEEEDADEPQEEAVAVEEEAVAEEEEAVAVEEEAVAEEEEAVAEEEEADAEEEEAVAEEEEEELELFEVEIKGKSYVTDDEMNGSIYDYVNDEVGEIVGAFKNGVAKFTKKQKSKTSQ